MLFFYEQKLQSYSPFYTQLSVKNLKKLVECNTLLGVKFVHY